MFRLLVLGALVSGPALAQSTSCTVPANLRAPPVEPIKADEQRRTPTVGHMLALSWSPEFCRTRADDPEHRTQCGGQPFGFILHGLWPQGANSRHPRYCAPAAALDLATVKRHFCMTPSVSLLQHEWAAHGSCGWRTGASYLAQAETLWRAVRLPAVDRLPREKITAGTIRDAFVAANPAIPRDALFVATSNRQWLREVRICYDRAFRYARCDGGSGAPDRVPVRVWRRS